MYLILVLIPAFFSFLNLLPQVLIWQEFICSFANYYFFHHLVTIIILFYYKNKISARKFSLGIVCLTLASLQYFQVILPFYLPANKIDFNQNNIEHQKIKILYANVQMTNTNYRLLAQQIKSLSPDIVALLEVNQDWLNALDLNKIYTNKIELPRNDYWGLALYSNQAFEIKLLNEPSPDLPPILLAKGDDYSISLVHLPHMLQRNGIITRNFMLRRLVAGLKNLGQDFILLGDFNLTPYSAKFRTLGDFKNAMHGFGLQKSWYASNPFLNFTIDHVFYQGKFQIKNFQTLDAIGSDHYAYYLEIEK